MKFKSRLTNPSFEVMLSRNPIVPQSSVKVEICPKLPALTVVEIIRR